MIASFSNYFYYQVHYFYLLGSTSIIYFSAAYQVTSLRYFVQHTAHCCPLPLPPFFYPAVAAISIRLPVGEKTKKTKTKTKQKNKRHSPNNAFKKQLNSVVPRLWVLFRPPQCVAFPPYDRDDDDSYTFDNKKYTKYTHSSIPSGL